MRSACLGVHFLDAHLACHSRATASKLFTAATLADRFEDCLTTPGSTSLASSFRASSRLSRAFAKLTSGYTPMHSLFSFPAKRYLMRQDFKPLGAMYK